MTIMCVDFPLGLDYYFHRRSAPLAVYDAASLVFLGQTEGPAERAADGTVTLTYKGARYVAARAGLTVWWTLAPLAAADVVLVARSRWTAPDGNPITREVFEIRGGAVAREWAAELRPPEAAWCSVTLWNEVGIGGYGGSVWPTAWRDLFCIGPSAPRSAPRLTAEGVARFAAARAAGVGGLS